MKDFPTLSGESKQNSQAVSLKPGIKWRKRIFHWLLFRKEPLQSIISRNSL